MIKYRWFRYPALFVIIGFAAVCGIAVGGTAINSGRHVDLNNTQSIAQFNDWSADWRWVSAGLVSINSAGFQRSAPSTLSISYRTATKPESSQGQPQTLSIGRGSSAAQIGYSDQQGGDRLSVATQLYIQF